MGDAHFRRMNLIGRGVLKSFVINHFETLKDMLSGWLVYVQKKGAMNMYSMIGVYLHVVDWHLLSVYGLRLYL